MWYGSSSVTGPQASMVSAKAASALWNPYARLIMLRILFVQSFVASVGQVTVDRGGDAVFVIADRAGGFDEFRDTRSLSPGAPAVQR